MTFDQLLCAIISERYRQRTPLQEGDFDYIAWELCQVRESLLISQKGRETLAIDASTEVGTAMVKALRAFIACLEAFDPSTYQAIETSFITTLNVLVFS